MTYKSVKTIMLFVQVRKHGVIVGNKVAAGNNFSCFLLHLAG